MKTNVKKLLSVLLVVALLLPVFANTYSYASFLPIMRKKIK